MFVGMYAAFRFIAGVSVLLVILILAACGGETEQNDRAASPDTSGRIVAAPPDSASPDTSARTAARDTAATASSDTSDGAWLPADPRSEAMRYTRYRNDEYGYSIRYPAAVLEPTRTIGDGRGRAFETRDGAAAVIVYAVENADRQRLEAEYEKALNNPNMRVTYNVLRDDWYVVSGYEGDDVFYERVLLEDGMLKTFRTRYKSSQKDYYDPITAAISQSFEG